MRHDATSSLGTNTESWKRLNSVSSNDHAANRSSEGVGARPALERPHSKSTNGRSSTATSAFGKHAENGREKRWCVSTTARVRALLVTKAFPRRRLALPCDVGDRRSTGPIKSVAPSGAPADEPGCRDAR